MNRNTSRVSKLEANSKRFKDLACLSDVELLTIIFGYDTPEFHAAKAMERAGDDAGLENMLHVVAEQSDDNVSYAG